MTGSLGFRQRADEHKTQWLSTHGTPDYLSVFSELFSSEGEDLPTLNLHFVGRNGNGLFLNDRLYKKLDRHSGGFTDRGQRAAIARSVQEHLEQTVLGLVESYRKKTGARHLCLAGGVFLNSLLVQALEERSGFDEIFVQPAAGNPGTALGVAYLSLTSGARERPPAMQHLFLGPKASDHETKSVLDNCKVVYRFLKFENELINETVRLLSDQKVVAWHQGRLEFGHRALGNRSILASPFSTYVKANLNEFIKHREDFHPFILSVPAEDASRFFNASSNCAFATSIGTVREDIHDFDHLMFSGRHVRLHLVERETNPRYWELLQAFGKGAPAPVLVNTSFNLFGEPLVSSPRDAIRTFYCSGLDALVVGDFLVLKR